MTARAAAPPAPGSAEHPPYLVGLDVGSTTVKYVVVEPATRAVIRQDYQRHDTRQAEKCLEMLEAIEAAVAASSPGGFRVVVTGSGGAPIASLIGATFVQEVYAVTLAVERLHPEARSVVELGGQDAKIIVFLPDPDTGRIRKVPSMNDKCAGGTGAVLDKIAAKLGIPGGRLAEQRYHGVRVHPVAAKCGVFAETDINGLQKQGVPPDELLASLFESIVRQNLAVLARGHTLHPPVLLLGGPNGFVRGLQECWRHHIRLLWEERAVIYDPHRPLEELIVVPPNALFFAALGATEFGAQEPPGPLRGGRGLLALRGAGRAAPRPPGSDRGLWTSREELNAFRRAYGRPAWSPPALVPGRAVRAFIGLDGGSTSTKAVATDERAEVVAKAYRLSTGNPIRDSVEVLGALEDQVTRRGARLEVLGVATTGYAKDILKNVLEADLALVETVAHAQAGLRFHPEVDVIVDVGGQDIKLIMLGRGQVKDFRLNTQCSAGNGYFLQATAQALGVEVDRLADVAFRADSMPRFGHGCAVFLQSDIVEFQRQGWRPEEILAGLCDVLPRNVWLHVSQIPNLSRLGRTFLLQGGTHHNLAVVKAQVNFIRARFRGTGLEPRVLVHPFCGEAGAIGCAIEAQRRHRETAAVSRFIGFDRVRAISHRTTRSEATRCHFCGNRCQRTFVDVRTAPGAAGLAPPGPARPVSAVPLALGEQRVIVAGCDKGTVEDVEQMRAIKRGLDAVRAAHPNFAEVCAREAFAPARVRPVTAPPAARGAWVWRVTPGGRGRRARRAARAAVRIGMPRVLNMYSMAPWFMAYFEALGMPAANLVWSDATSGALYRAGASRGAVDPCFPSKVAIAHVHDLLFNKHGERRPLRCIFFPMIDSLPTFLEGTAGARACPTVTATPEAVKAAFTKEEDLFAARGVEFLDTFLTFAERGLLARQMRAAFGDRLGLARHENDRACETAWAHYETYHARLRKRARAALDRLERTGGLGVVLLDRPYHADPGIGHEIAAEFQKLGFPVFTADVLPRDPDLLHRLFGDEIAAGLMPGALAVDDVWKHAYSENTNRKLWAAKYVARHRHLVAVEISSFKCGHDAPIASVVEEIVEASGTPYFRFRDVDENRPTASIRIRVETIAYFLEHHRRRREGAAPHAPQEGEARDD